MSALETKLLPYVQAKVPACVSVLLPSGNGQDSWCRAYTDPLRKGFQVVYLWEVLPRTLWAEFGLAPSQHQPDRLPYTV